MGPGNDNQPTGGRMRAVVLAAVIVTVAVLLVVLL